MKEPINLIGEILGIESLDKDSSFGKTSNWESLNHIKIIVAMEKDWGIEIKEEDVEKYTNMEAINELYEQVKKQREL
jgi:acyl carrier protein